MRSPSGRASMGGSPIKGRIGFAADQHNARAKEKLWRAREGGGVRCLQSGSRFAPSGLLRHGLRRDDRRSVHRPASETCGVRRRWRDRRHREDAGGQILLLLATCLHIARAGGNVSHVAVQIHRCQLDRMARDLSLVTCRANLERRLREPSHEPLKMHDPLSGQSFMQLGDLLGFGDKRFADLFRVLHLKLKGLDG